MTQPLLGHYTPFRANRLSSHPDPRVFQHVGSPCQGAGARATGTVVTERVHDSTAPGVPSPTTARFSKRQREAEPAPKRYVEVHGGESQSGVRRDGE